MFSKASKSLGLVFLLIISVSYGCSTTSKYGTYSFAPPSKQGVTIDSLYKNWKDYHVFYAGVSTSQPNAILFDPRKDDRRLIVHKWWVEVKDPETMSELMGFIYNSPWYPSLRSIIGPDHQLYGYLFSVYWNVPIKVVDNKTMWIDDLSTIPELHGDWDGSGVPN